MDGSHFAAALASHKATALEGGRLSPLMRHVFEADVERANEMRSKGRRPGADQSVLDWLVLDGILDII